jgi:CspA family cold shock protein
MLWFNEAKGYGFIETETGERLYVHESAFIAGQAPVGRCSGLAVEFSRSLGESGYVATHVSRQPEVDQRRTTRHNSARAVR